MFGYDGHRGWVYYLAVKPGQQRKGIARRLLLEGERLLLERGCPKLELMVRKSNAQAIAVYEQLGYQSEEVVVMGKRLVNDQEQK